MKKFENNNFVFSNANYANEVYRVSMKNSDSEEINIEFDFKNFVMSEDNDSFNNIRIILNEAFAPKKYNIDVETKEALTKKIYNAIIYCIEKSTKDIILFRHINTYYEDDNGKAYDIGIYFKNKAPESMPGIYRIDKIEIEIENFRKREKQSIVGEDIEDNPPYITYGFEPKIIKTTDSDGNTDSFDFKIEMEDNKFKDNFYNNILPEIEENVRISLA